MSKFTIKVKLQGLEIEVEGTREDAPKIAHRVGQQLSTLLQPAALLTSGNGNPGAPLIDAEPEAEEKKKRRKAVGGSTKKLPTESVSLSHDSASYGSPQQSWTTTQKAIWFLYIVSKQANVTQMTGYSIAKNFNTYFRASGIIHGGNVSQGLEKERLKGTNATVNADMSDGTAKYFLTQAGITMAEKLVKGEAVTE